MFDETAKRLESACCALIDARLARVQRRKFVLFPWLRYRFLIRKLRIARKKLYGK